jgi:hypothetical protein
VASTRSQLESLADSLSKFDAGAVVEWQVGKIANVLIEQAKSEEPDSAVLQAIDAFEEGGNGYIDHLHAGAIRTILKQAAEALPRRMSIG